MNHAAAAEIDETARVFDNLFDQMKERPVGFYDDAHYWLAAFPYGIFRRIFLGAFILITLSASASKTAENEAEEELRQTCLEKMKAQTDRVPSYAYCGETLAVADPTLLLEPRRLMPHITFGFRATVVKKSVPTRS